MDQNNDFLLPVDFARDPVDLFDRIWEKAYEKAQKEYPDNDDKMHDQLQRHILEMLTLVEQPVSEITNNITNTSTPEVDSFSWLDIFVYIALLVLIITFFFCIIFWN